MQITNIKELREDLLSVYNDLKAHKRTAKEVRELARVANQVIHTASVELNYKKFMGSKSEIKFLEGK